MAWRSNEAFEQFPRKRLTLKLDRRQMLSLFTTELRVASDVACGNVAMKLPDLGTVPDEVIELLKPRRNPECRIVEEDGVICGYCAGERRVALFSSDAPARSVLKDFDGQVPLWKAGTNLAEATGWDSARAFAYVRGVFLHLVTLGVCFPQ
jgi:hypothetical protein